MAITLTQLRAFLAVAEAGSVHLAARKLYVSQPSVSAAISALGRELHADLVERNGRGIRLTPAGEAFRPYAAQVLGLLEQGREAAQEAARPAQNRIRIMAVTTAGEYVAPALIEAYRRLHPEAELLLEIGNRKAVLDRVASHAVDVGIGGRPIARGVAGEPILDNDLVVVGREPIEDLAEATWLLREEGSGTRATTERFLAEIGVEPATVLTLGSNGAVKEALRLGLGVTLVSELAVARELEAGELVRIPAPGTPISRPWYALVAEGVRLRPSVRRFLAFLRSEEARNAVARATRVGCQG
ncbi:MAG: LysR family transcriptional regulator [Thermoleophilia bacterium]|nr:LysR family transcriptional regulator [Thermoleophilia bacterium]